MQVERNRQYSWQADPMVSEGLGLFGIEVYWTIVEQCWNCWFWGVDWRRRGGNSCRTWQERLLGSVTSSARMQLQEAVSRNTKRYQESENERESVATCCDCRRDELLCSNASPGTKSFPVKQSSKRRTPKPQKQQLLRRLKPRVHYASVCAVLLHFTSFHNLVVQKNQRVYQHIYICVCVAILCLQLSKFRLFDVFWLRSAFLWTTSTAGARPTARSGWGWSFWAADLSLKAFDHIWPAQKIALMLKEIRNSAVALFCMRRMDVVYTWNGMLTNWIAAAKPLRFRTEMLGSAWLSEGGFSEKDSVGGCDYVVIWCNLAQKDWLE